MSQLLAGRIAIKAQQLRPGQGFAAEVRTGHYLQIATVDGKQVSDFVAFNAEDTAEHLSTAVTRSMNNTIMLQQGMKLYSNRRNPMFELVEDRVGRHDILFAACDPRRYADDYGLEGHANCREALTEALNGRGIDYDQIPDPVNWFMNVAIGQRGVLEIRESLAERSDYVLLEALMDAIVAITACPQDQNAVNGHNPTDILVRIFK
ncbi:MAG: DUF1989 domain-containing protein [Thermomicrobiales bacterium]